MSAAVGVSAAVDVEGEGEGEGMTRVEGAAEEDKLAGTRGSAAPVVAIVDRPAT